MNFKSFVLAVMATLPVMAFAYTVSGTVTDESGEPLSEATARLLTARDSSYVKGGAANIDGKFSLADIKSGKYILETSYIGYNKKFTPVNVSKDNVNLGNIVMSETSHLLKEATVTAVKTPVKVMEDTIEFNADSYKTQPNSVVEDLLKRLPGVEVDSDGKITANGKEITKILVDGKEFFSDDPKVASKNLPVDMIDKLQVVDRKSDLARMTGVDDGEDETVINLTVKKGMKNGWFGTIEGGYGTDDRYLGSFNVNRFWNGNQITFLGNANNTNQLGFTDGNGNRFRRFGGDQGINNSQSFGVNFNVGKEEIIRVGGNVMYSHTDRDSRKRQNRLYLLEENSYTQNSLSNANDKGHNVRADFRVEWKPDSFNTLDFRPRFSYNQNNSFSEQFSVSEGKNRSFNLSNSDGKSYEAGGRLIYNHNFSSHRGRSFSIFANYRMTNVHEYDDSYVYNYFFGDDSYDIYDQYTDNKTWSNFVSGRLTWTEPIGNAKNGNFMTVGYSAQMRWNNADKLVYDRDVTFDQENVLLWHYMLGDKIYDIPVPTIDTENPELDPDLSNRFRNTTFQQDFRLGYKKVSSKYTLDLGMSLVPIRSKSDNLINPEKNVPSRLVWNLAPFVRLRYKFDKNSSLNMNYSGRSSQPTMAQLQPVADYSNPLNVVQGNPSLVPTFNHNMHLRFQLFNPEAQRSIMTMLFARLEQNSIISKTDFNMNTGGRYTTYENVNGIWNARLMNMFSQPLRNKAFTFNNNIFLSYDHRVGYNQVAGGNAAKNQSNSFSVGESFAFAFRPDNLELELRPNYYLQTTRNSVSSLSNTTVHRFGGNFNATYYTPFGIVLASELSYSANRGYSNGYNDDSWMWNASISYQFLPGKAATVMLKAYDILQQNRDISHSVTASYIDDTQFNALTRYVMLSFTYKFNTFGAGNVPQDRNSPRFGPPGGGPR